MHKKSNVQDKRPVSLRPDVDSDDEIDQEVQEEAQKMDALMRQLLGKGEQEQVDNEQLEQDTVAEEEFSFRLFAHQPLAKVAIAEDTKDDGQAQAVADMQQLEFDEHDPELMARVKEAAIDYNDILRQSTVPYPAMQFPHRVIKINSVNKSITEKSKRKRKSKKCRDFEKKVKAGEIKVQPNMRNPDTPGGWPGWPGQLTRVSIINYISPRRKEKTFNKPRPMNKSFSRGGAKPQFHLKRQYNK
ncbi:hypothetical protein RMATCC62417_00532 [Rhizopus microsporus]|nr:hypothetical protein RMATCC62417_00532 [Rhizopus microsporus]